MRRTTTSATPESYYFAYGANLHIAHMKSRCPRSAPVCAARLEDYRLTIALPAAAPDNQPGWATVTPRKGAGTPGALFRLHADDLPALDRFEDYPALYNRKNVEIRTDDGARQAMIYIMVHPLRAARPTAPYAQTLRQGYADFDLSMEALESVLGEISSYHPGTETSPP